MVDQRFWVSDGRQADFEVVFGPDGIWQELLGQAKAGDYRGSKFECESRSERKYRVRDFWASHLTFEVFRRRLAVDVEKFNSLLLADGLVERQKLVGEYYVDEDGDGDNPVSAEG